SPVSISCTSYLVRCTSCFFFQAEDGIRDRTVTGVQTCALPISSFGRHSLGLSWPPRIRFILINRRVLFQGGIDDAPCFFDVILRSEERRVGKEGMLWGGRESFEKNENASALARSVDTRRDNT